MTTTTSPSQQQHKLTIEHILYETDDIYYIKWRNKSVLECSFVSKHKILQQFPDGVLPKELSNQEMLTDEQFRIWNKNGPKVREIVTWCPCPSDKTMVEYKVLYENFDTPLYEPYSLQERTASSKDGSTSTTVSILKPSDVDAFSKKYKRGLHIPTKTKIVSRRRRKREKLMMKPQEQLEIRNVDIKSVDKVHDMLFFSVDLTIPDGSIHSVTMDQNAIIEYFPREALHGIFQTMCQAPSAPGENSSSSVSEKIVAVGESDSHSK